MAGPIKCVDCKDLNNLFVNYSAPLKQSPTVNLSRPGLIILLPTQSANIPEAFTIIRDLEEQIANQTIFLLNAANFLFITDSNDHPQDQDRIYYLSTNMVTTDVSAGKHPLSTIIKKVLGIFDPEETERLAHPPTPPTRTETPSQSCKEPDILSDETIYTASTATDNTIVE